ncbi:hypothetical protein BJX70DRAFT_367928 [Aspergillus crustosus]
MTQSLNACLPCTLKKRKCDRSLPRCSTCARSKINQDCVYRDTIDGQILQFDEKSSLSLSTGHSLQPPQKSLLACEKCRVGKRACSKDLPKCSRCARFNVPCSYENTRAPAQTPHDLQLKPQYPILKRDYYPALIHSYSEMFFLPEFHRAQNSLTTHLNTAWMRRAMEDPCLFHGALFSASAHFDWAQGVSHNPRTLFHQSQALKMLQERLRDGQVGYETTATALSLTYYSVSAYDTETALVHKRGLLQMFSTSHDRGSDYEGLTGLVNLILLGLSMVLNQPPSFVPSISVSPDTPIQLKCTAQPSDLLNRALLRYDNNEEVILSPSMISELQNVLDFIILAENASIADLYTVYADAIEKRIHMPPIDLLSVKTKTSRNINQGCHLAVEIFWTIFSKALYPNVTKPRTPSENKECDTPPTLTALRAVLQKVDLQSWQQLAPEVYIWICLTAAAACDAVSDRVPFITMPTPVLSASDSSELGLTREGLWYFRWLVGFV